MPIKLALIRQIYNPFGGAERFVQRALSALGAQGVGVALIARKWPRDVALGETRLVTCNPFYVGRLWRDAGFARRALALARDCGFDLVQSHERIPGCDIYRAGDGVHATWLELRRPTLTSAGRLGQLLNPWHRYVLATEAQMFRDPRLRAVICNSQMVRNDIEARFGVAGSKLRVIYSGIDLDRFHPSLRSAHRDSLRASLAVEPKTPLLLYVGSGFARKGVATLLDALALMQRKGVQLLVLGRDRHHRRFVARAARLGVAERVHFVGGVQDVRPYCGAADAFVLPTLYDPFPNAALEALACGLPIVTSRTCGAAELVTQGRNGFVCDALDAAALAYCLDDICMPGAADAMREAARASVAHLSANAMAAQLVDLYRELLPPLKKEPGDRL